MGSGSGRAGQEDGRGPERGAGLEGKGRNGPRPPVGGVERNGLEVPRNKEGTRGPGRVAGTSGGDEGDEGLSVREEGRGWRPTNSSRTRNLDPNAVVDLVHWTVVGGGRINEWSFTPTRVEIAPTLPSLGPDVSACSFPSEGRKEGSGPGSGPGWGSTLRNPFRPEGVTVCGPGRRPPLRPSFQERTPGKHGTRPGKCGTVRVPIESWSWTG